MAVVQVFLVSHHLVAVVVEIEIVIKLVNLEETVVEVVAPMVDK
jgi:hypothetical protein